MKFLPNLLRLTVLGFLGSIWLLAGCYLYLSPNLPDVNELRDIKLQTPMRIYTSDGVLIGQFGEQKRSPLIFENIPKEFVDALLAAEDDGFFQHRGIDFMGLLRAVSEIVLTGEKGSGGSTLTMQVARNYFLTLEKTYIRKLNEILLAIEIERALSKEEIFELYFNRIFLGHRAYGFNAAAQVYYGKQIDELSLAQLAMLAGIPKAPSRNNPITGPENSKERRNWILGRMLSLGYINQQQYAEAKASPVTAKHHGARIAFHAPYVAEMARREMLQRYGTAAYNDGYSVYTTITEELQKTAQKAVIDGLLNYDFRHGYRGPEQNIPPIADDLEASHNQWLVVLGNTPTIADMQAAIVTEVLEDSLTILLADGSFATILWDNGLLQSARYLTESSVAPRPETAVEVAEVGDLIRVSLDDEGQYHMTQIPAAQGAIVALNPNNGAIMSLVGGLGFEESKFNRATQAKRQPGSNFKPFLYSAALDAGYTAASLINDAPVVFEDASLEGAWRPENDSGKFYGPTRLRWALTKSRNLVSIRMLKQLGIERGINYVERFGFNTSEFTRDLSIALGTPVMTPLKIATAYASLANGGYKVEPYLIERIENARTEVVFTANPPTVCRHCSNESYQEDLGELSMEQILNQEKPEQALVLAPRIMDARVNYIVDSMLQDVITKGTGTRALALERSDLAGKTGTTNGPKDAWFSGYNRDVVTTAWVGFDDYTPLGRREFGGTAALPIWIDYMRVALKDSPDLPRPMPAGIVSVRIDPETGLLARSGQANAMTEYFRQEHAPKESSEGSSSNNQDIDDLIIDIF